ncbi:23S rRNA pseudouridine(1911/1915/1917) synthase RluD [Elongatibacter sediminis]|uniref:Pseudouridine synthase n=1 Tax=Elongatibacter sediminis TaxID=3119006 RepID=A0AAW9RL20_9GAMM
MTNPVDKPSGNDAGRIRLRAVADSAQAGCRFDQAAAVLFADYSRARLQKWIRSGALTVDGRREKPTFRLHGGEVLRIDAEPEPDTRAEAEPIPLDIVHADDDLIVVNKPAGLVVHPAAGHPAGTLQNALLHFDPELAAVPRAGIVHRLDKDTSGIMVVARSLRAHTRLVAQLQSRSMSRIYEAVVRGEMRRRGTVDQPIGRHPRDRKRMAVVPGGRPAITHYRVLTALGAFTHLQVSLETGRTHQIRVHMSHLGHPLVGDRQYGRKPGPVRGLDPRVVAAVREFPRQALHARTLVLRHPADDAECRFTTDLPEDFSGLLARLRGGDD